MFDRLLEAVENAKDKGLFNEDMVADEKPVSVLKGIGAVK